VPKESTTFLKRRIAAGVLALGLLGGGAAAVTSSAAVAVGAGGTAVVAAGALAASRRSGNKEAAAPVVAQAASAAPSDEDIRKALVTALEDVAKDLRTRKIPDSTLDMAKRVLDLGTSVAMHPSYPSSGAHLHYRAEVLFGTETLTTLSAYHTENARLGKRGDEKTTLMSNLGLILKGAREVLSELDAVTVSTSTSQGNFLASKYGRPGSELDLR
jgi:hypothetical protein